MLNAPSPDEVAPQAAIEKLIGAPIGEAALYERALTHRSHARGQPAAERPVSNERLEFLGDAVLGALVAEALYEQFPEKDEGYLTRLRAKLVSGRALAGAARRLELGPHIHMSENMAQAGGAESRTILSDAFEALIGALYLDRGLDAACAFVRRTVLDPVNLSELAVRHDNYKSLLLEYVQARGQLQPRYRVVRAEGPSHERTFTVEVLIDDVRRGAGQASSKKKAEQHAARQALDGLRDGNG